jgi:hypothetical protein
MVDTALVMLCSAACSYPTWEEGVEGEEAEAAARPPRFPAPLSPRGSSATCAQPKTRHFPMAISVHGIAARPKTSVPQRGAEPLQETLRTGASQGTGSLGRAQRHSGALQTASGDKDARNKDLSTPRMYVERPPGHSECRAPHRGPPSVLGLAAGGRGMRAPLPGRALLAGPRPAGEQGGRGQLQLLPARGAQSPADVHKARGVEP